MATLSNFISTNTTNKILQNATVEVMENETAAGRVQLQFFFTVGTIILKRHRLPLYRSNEMIVSGKCNINIKVFTVCTFKHRFERSVDSV